MDERSELYSADELLDGFSTGGFTGTWDFGIFREFMRTGGAAPGSAARRKQALHDATISDALMGYLLSELPLVGIMGGHKVHRDSPAYRAVAELTNTLAGEFLVASGGGPGAMEAAHVGAAAPDLETVDRLINRLSAEPELPRLIDIVDRGGNVIGTPETLAAAERWLAAGIDARSLLKEVRPSLAIPTWLYGQEPTMPFATAYAKYFHNSIREEALVKQSAAGIIYARGGGGTLREIFQDVEENYYAPSANAFTPMIFFDPEGYWQRDFGGTADGIDLDDLLRRIIVKARAGTGDANQCLAKIHFTTDVDEVLEALRAHRGVARQNLELMSAGGAGDLFRALLR
ncbi:LOG family protein [Nocardioides sp. CPCC 206347]|uniref:LOG family protein n=1 Tax=unclassified Nocardioides TaxID=2615069 RepID=UPI0036182AC2